MRLLIHGCGVVGTLVGNRLAAAGHQVIGIRRQPDAPALPAAFPIEAGDAADPAVHARLGPADGVLLAANPGLRARSRAAAGGNRLLQAAGLLVATHPAARLVYTGTTSVYGDADGGPVDEDGPLADDPEAAALLAIEAAILAHPRALVLRVAAITGPTRTGARERVRAAAAAGEPLVVRGDPGRPFSHVHEDDLADLCRLALVDEPGWTGIRNVACGEALTVAGYHQAIASAEGLAVQVVGDGSRQARRSIRARPEIAGHLLRRR